MRKLSATARCFDIRPVNEVKCLARWKLGAARASLGLGAEFSAFPADLFRKVIAPALVVPT